MDEFANTTPVSPPMVNRKMNPRAHKSDGVICIWVPCRVPSQLNTLIPVGTAIIIVAEVK